MFNSIVTIFCLHADTTWYPVTISDCQLIVDRAARREKTGIADADAAKLFIQSDQLASLGLEVIGPKEYDTLMDPEGKLAFHEGKDFFVKGELPGISLNEEDYPSGLYDYLHRTRDGVHLITSAAEYYVLPHWEITGK